MLRGTYVGVKRCRLMEADGDAPLKGKTALLREIPGDTVNIEAQFDDMNLEHAFKWHRYKRTEFEITKSVDVGKNDWLPVQVETA